MKTNNLKTPIVEFEYPESNSNAMKVRYVRVVEMNQQYLKGYEVSHPASPDQGKYKQYRRSRIVRNGVALVSF